jgi:nitroimidazol reductase NimA-like FMN-containing flavoprotein (pyridoxamine 5'-phosphate oxidase superfamily)
VPTRQGDVALLDEPLARSLLQAPIPAQLAYTWTDGTPRVLPMWFHWDGRQILMGTPSEAPKLIALTRAPDVALTINTYEFPYRALYVRGTASVQMMDEVAPEYVLMAQRCLGPGADGWLEQVKAMLPAMGGMARVAVTPRWVGLIDFEQRFPSAIERAVAAAASP